MCIAEHKSLCIGQTGSLYAQMSQILQLIWFTGRQTNTDKYSSNCDICITVLPFPLKTVTCGCHSYYKLTQKCLYIHQRCRFRFIYITRILSVKLRILRAFFSPMGVHPLLPGDAKHKKFKNQHHKLYNKLYIAMSLTISSNW